MDEERLTQSIHKMSHVMHVDLHPYIDDGTLDLFAFLREAFSRLPLSSRLDLIDDVMVNQEVDRWLLDKMIGTIVDSMRDTVGC